MSLQIIFLKNLISSAESGNQGAETLLRQICIHAIEKAPSCDLMTIARCLVDVGVEASRRQIELN